jgi:aldose sugar dehydrogenase
MTRATINFRSHPAAGAVVLTSLALLLAGCEPATSSSVGGDLPPAPGAVEPEVVTVVEGLANPWGIAFLPDGDILITERPGRLRVVREGRLLPDPVPGTPQVRAQGQGGLLDVALHPAFATNRLVYLSYSRPGDRGATTAIARGRFEGDRLTGVEDVFVAEAWGTGGQHFGGRLLFDRDGFLYLTIGDRGTPERAQDLGDHAGTTLRLHDDGAVPADNPFAGRAGARPEIYTYGNRNAQGMALHPETGEIWQNEHGPRGGDEINVIRAGANYGWPRVSFGDHYDGRPIPDPSPGAEFQLPVLHWTPSIAPSGLEFYTGDALPQWRGNAFVGALVGQHLRRVALEGERVVEQEELLAGRGQRIRAVRQGPDGSLYLLVDAATAPVLRLQPRAGQ